MLQILTQYQVAPEFLEVLFSFGTDPNIAESGNSNVAVVDAAGGIQRRDPLMDCQSHADP
jgi:hypothetical protein